ncbi:MAG: glycosyltransferase family 4 protein [Bryobacteraceae bacterium]
MNGDLDAWERRAEGSRHILVIDHHLPLSDRDSGSLRMFHILTLLHELGHEVTFIPDNLADISPYGDDLRRRGIEVIHHPYLTSIREFLEANGKHFDVAILSRRDFARKHMGDVRRFAPQARLVFDTVDLHFLREKREAELTDNAELAQNTEENRRLEYELIDEADETWVVSPVEKDLLHEERPQASIEVISNIVPIADSVAPFGVRRDILFIGSFLHTPNIDAVLFFRREILPQVHRQLSGLRFYIIGDKAPPEIIALADDKVIVTGYQPDVSIYFDAIKLSVAPLRYGAGVKGKINQSMGLGVPVVATPVAVEGMSLIDGKEVLLAEDPAVFAAKLIEAYLSEELWQRLSRNGLAKTGELFSLEAARDRLAKLFALGHYEDTSTPCSASPERQLLAS